MNHREALYKSADQSFLEKSKPYDDEHGWTRTEGGLLEPVSSWGAALPNSLVDLMDTGDIDEEEEEEEEEETEDGRI